MQKYEFDPYTANLETKREFIRRVSVITYIGTAHPQIVVAETGNKFLLMNYDLINWPPMGKSVMSRMPLIFALNKASGSIAEIQSSWQMGDEKNVCFFPAMDSKFIAEDRRCLSNLITNLVREHEALIVHKHPSCDTLEDIYDGSCTGIPAVSDFMAIKAKVNEK